MSFFSELKRRNVFRVGIAYFVIGWVLIQVADTAFPAFGAPEWVLRIFMLFVALGFPVALVMAWALELTPQGVRKAGGKNTPIYLLASAMAAVSLYWYISGQPSIPEATAPPTAVETRPDQEVEQETIPSIAILPFENMSRDEANEPFTVGIHDDLLTQVSKIGSLRTISRTSVLQFPGTDKTVPEIARELGVSTVLEGGVQMAGNQVRINVQLIDAVTDEHIWAETYDRELSAANIFAIQSEIATSIANALQATLTVDDRTRLESAPTGNLEALEAYFTGKHLADQRKIELIEAAVQKFEQAIELDPGFALAHAGLAYAWLLVPEYSASADRTLARQTAQTAMDRALEIDPQLPEGLTMIGWSYMAHDYNWKGAEVSLLKALSIQAGHTGALHWLSHVLSWQGRHDEAIVVAERALESDPLSPLMNTNMAYILMDVGRFDESREFRDRALHLQSDYAGLWRMAWMSELRAGEFGNAAFTLKNWAAQTGRDPGAAAELGQLMEQMHSSGQVADLPESLLDSLAIGTQSLPQVYAAVGDAELTLAALRIGLDERAGSRSVLSMKINPLYDFIRDDPRFIAMLQEVNLAP